MNDYDSTEGEVKTVLKGYQGFGSFMTDDSVENLINAPPDQYIAPVLPIDTSLHFTVPSEFGKQQRSLFMLDNEYFFLNHGAFGAVARPAYDAAVAWREYAERQPLKFIDRE